MRRMNARKWLCLVAAAAVLGACQTPDSDASPADQEEGADAIPVETLRVSTIDFEERFDVPGVVEPLEPVVVSAESGGRVLSVPFEEGEQVRGGSRLLQVDTQLDSARINLLENQLDSARREYERTEKLSKNGLATPQQLEQADTALENARLNLEQAKIGASKGGVRSPVTGTVLQKHVERGEFVAPGAPVATLAELDEMIVRAHVPETRIRHLQEGDTVQVRLPALDDERQATVRRRSLSASPRTGTFGVELLVDNADGEIRAGMSARISMVKQRWEEAVIVPREAILQGFSRSEAMVLGGDDEVANAELRVVELGPSSGPDVLILSGLSAGERLIVRGHRRLVDGATARAVRHFDDIEHMRTAGVKLGNTDEGEDE
jgi:membrane fusion protein, multidrug efflux system